jgi:response regulator RpfG family c-di-GMP phosphodiesterase
MDNTKLIAYIDDDVDDLEIMMHAFKGIEGLVIHGFINQDLFLEFVAEKNSRVCLALIDINMPMRSGIELACLISNSPKTEKVPVILFTTSKTLPESQANRWKHITKPCSLAEIEAVVHRIVTMCRTTS